MGRISATPRKCSCPMKSMLLSKLHRIGPLHDLDDIPTNRDKTKVSEVIRLFGI